MEKWLKIIVGLILGAVLPGVAGAQQNSLVDVALPESSQVFAQGAVSNTAPPTSRNTHKYAFGVNYPGVNFRLFFSKGFAAELKAQYMDKIGVGGLLLYFYPRVFKAGASPLKFFWGIEGDYISFKGDLSKGSGYAAEAFGGVEIFLFKGLSLQADIGPAYIGIADKKTSINSSGLQFVVNSGMNFYF